MSENTTHSRNNSNNGSGIRSTVNQKASTAFTMAQHSIDRVVPPSSRQRAYTTASAYAKQRPILFSFIVSQLALSFLPLLTFTVFSLSTIAFSLGAAVLFSLFWIGLAFMLLVPTLLATSSLAVLVWAWVAGTFVVARWLYVRSPFAGSGGGGVFSGEMEVDAAGRQVRVKKDEQGLGGAIDGKH
ncbi:hypothetical protein ACRE_038050 [Hapsidospora chrysogenum ATCC 11550]|uniref:Uncharacterized protein n=1 Tax=Hapsidospora chrysogenum (strain ATCC 11550 / CBS 779.69 / DSM 880 / IAM 14645 / JCM 23072 / IMI 49137) TaxID=857340 RepID=A0A086T7Q9_HAPC1|nr:hypothetical protein ACRE_038050 [Hapsidospora chrysogenum ATCC 11550]